jgi:cell division septal protein FtsQ
VRYVKANEEGEPVFLVKGTDNIREGPIRSLFHGQMFLEALQEISYDLSRKNSYKLSASKDNDRYFITLQHEDIYQVISSVENLSIENLPSLVWVGDLDRDNKLDLFLYLGLDDYRGEYSLFLSSYADKSNLVKKVATFSTSGD